MVHVSQILGGEGVVLADARGGLVWWSAAMDAALERTGLRWTLGMRCCDAMGCERDDCLTSRALDSPEGVRTRRVGTDAAGRPLESTIVARPIRRGGTDLVVFEVRFGEHVAPAASPDVEIHALGPMSVTVAGRSRDGDWLQQRPGQVLRYLLASRSGAQRSEAIAAALWPERGPSAVANVRYCIFKLREQLGERADPSASLVIRDAAGYRLDPARLNLDVDIFQRQAAAGIAAHRRGETGPAESALTAALTLYRGDFLGDDPYADWAFAEREYLRSLAGKGLAALAQIALSGGRLVGAADHLQRLAQLEPFDSHVHQMLIEVCLRRGRRTEALRHYHALRARLQRAFGEQPDFELASLAAGVAGGRGELRGRSPRVTPSTVAFDSR
jgi:DNA-binding SARP family transcriptional activator